MHGDVKALKLGSREIGILRGDPSMEGVVGKIDDFGSRLGKALRLQETSVEPRGKVSWSQPNSRAMEP